MKRSISAQEARRLKEIRQEARRLERQRGDLTAEAYRIMGITTRTKNEMHRDFVFDAVNNPDFCTIDRMLRTLSVRVRKAPTPPR